mgnify:CR=1 FL=1
MWSITFVVGNPIWTGRGSRPPQESHQPPPSAEAMLEEVEKQYRGRELTCWSMGSLPQLLHAALEENRAPIISKQAPAERPMLMTLPK